MKNNLQIVSSLLQLQSSYVKDADALTIFEESRERIKSMALIHEQLYQSNDLAQINFPEYLRSLLSMVFSANRRGGARIESRLDVAPVSLDLDTAIPIGLIVNELVTNSLKYAFAGRDSGSISVELRNGNLDPAADSDHCTLIVRDDGIGLPKDFAFEKATSLGLRLVRILTKQMHGRLELSTDAGTEFRVHFRKGQHA